MSFFSANIARLHSPAMVKHFNYISREENYKKMKDLLYSESGNLPKWARTGKDYWETTKAQEDQVNADFKEGKREEAESVFIFFLLFYSRQRHIFSPQRYTLHPHASPLSFFPN